MKQLNFFLFLLLSISSSLEGQCPDQADLYFTNQNQIDQFIINYPNCQEYYGEIRIEGYSITNLDGLMNLNSINGVFYISNTPNLNSISGLNNIEHLGETSISGTGLTSIENAFSNLTSISGRLMIRSNSNLQYINDFDNLQIVNEITIDLNNNLTEINGFNSVDDTRIRIENRKVEMINAFGSMQKAKSISFSNFLEELLVQISPLQNLTEIEYSLHSSFKTDMNWLPNLQSISGGSLSLSNTLSIIGLNNLTDVSIIALTNNPYLNSLSGLENISSDSISQLFISTNGNLSSCSLPNICEFLQNGGNGVFYNNAPGCNSVQEVLDNCNMSVTSHELNSKINIYPNPVRDRINIYKSDNYIKIEKIVLLDNSGKILNEFKNQEKIDLGFYPSGNYILLIQTNQETISKKITIL